MNRKGIALLVALITVLLGGMIVAVATMVAAAEIRAGTSWSEQQSAASVSASVLANRVPDLEAVFDSLASGEAQALDESVSVSRLGDSAALLSVVARSRLGEDAYSTVVRVESDSGGAPKFRIPSRSRVRYHPIP